MRRLTMRLSRSTTLLGAASLLIGTAGGSVAVESVDVGATASSPNAAVSCGTGTTFFQDTVVVPPSYTTTAGVVTSWSSMAAVANPGIIELKVGREGPANVYTITGSAKPESLVANRLNSFRTRIPVQAGDVLALYLPLQGVTPGCAISTGNGGDVLRYASSPLPDPAVGTTMAATNDALGVHLNVSARIEPDADADGYGDLTQDACPSLKNSHDDCIAPDTFLKSAAKTLFTAGSLAKAKIAFFSSEAGATFTCAVDKLPSQPCSSPLKVKLKKGKHTVKIVSTDAVGNVDPDPLTVRVKVKRKA